MYAFLIAVVLVSSIVIGVILYRIIHDRRAATDAARRRAAQQRLAKQDNEVRVTETRRRINRVKAEPAPKLATPKAVTPSSLNNDFLVWLGNELALDAQGGPAMLPSTRKLTADKVIIDDESDVAQKQYEERLKVENKVGLPVNHAFAAGSKEACAEGCTCDRKLNQDGFGYMNVSRDAEHPSVINPKTGKAPYVYSIGCPLHWPRDLHEAAQAKLQAQTAIPVEDTSLVPVGADLDAPIAPPKKRTPRDIFSPIIRR